MRHFLMNQRHIMFQNDQIGRASSALILALDQGTTGSTAALFDADTMSCVAHANQEFAQIFPKPGWVEHDPEAIWQSVLMAIEKVFEIAASQGFARAADRIESIGITNQRETVVCWERQTGKPLCNAIVWQDRRTAERCQELDSNASWTSEMRQRTGLVADPYFSASKMEWMMKHIPGLSEKVHKGHAVFGTIDSYLCYRLNQGRVFATEPTNASRTMLLDLDSTDYHDDLLATFGIPREALAPIRDSIDDFGSTKGVPHLRDGIPIEAMLGDQQSALFGQRAFLPGEAKVTFGTGAFLLMQTGESIVRPKRESGLLTSVSLRRNGRTNYCLEGACFIAGAAVQYLRDQLSFFQSSSESEALALAQECDENVMFIPALAGLSAPFWNPFAKGALLGLSRGTSRSQITRAVLESIAFQNVPILREMEKSSGIPLKWLGVDGGAAQNRTLLEIQANALERPLKRPAVLEATALGAALAAKARRHPESVEPLQVQKEEIIHPNAESKAIASRYERWLRAVTLIDRFYKNEQATLKPTD